MYLLIQNGGGIDIPAEARALRELGLLGSIPPVEDGKRYAYRYYALVWRKTLLPFLNEVPYTPNVAGKRQEQIVRAFVLYPIMTPSLLGKVIHATTTTIEDTLLCMQDEGIICVFRLADARQAPRYYLSAYEKALRPFLPELT